MSYVKPYQVDGIYLVDEVLYEQQVNVPFDVTIKTDVQHPSWYHVWAELRTTVPLSDDILGITDSDAVDLDESAVQYLPNGAAVPLKDDEVLVAGTKTANADENGHFTFKGLRINPKAEGENVELTFWVFRQEVHYIMPDEMAHTTEGSGLV